MSTKRVTLSQIAQAAGVSTTAVSQVLNDRKNIRIAGATKALIKKTAVDLGYTFSHKRTSQHEQAVVLHVYASRLSFHVIDSFGSQLAQLLKEKCAEQSIQYMDVEFANTQGIESIKPILRMNPAVVITNSTHFVDIFHTQVPDIPIIFVQGPQPYNGVMNFLSEDEQVGEQAAACLLKQGYQRPVMLVCERTSGVTDKRTTGFQKCMQTAGIEPRIICFPYWQTDKLRTWLDNLSIDFDSVLCIDDYVALMLTASLQRRALCVPTDVGIIGTNDFFWGRESSPSLSTMSLNVHMFGEKVFHEIQRLVQGGEYMPIATTIPVTLIERASTQRSVDS